MTAAEKIAKQFGNDGQRFWIDDPDDPQAEIHLGSVCEANGGVPDYRDGRVGADTVAYRFADGSVLTIAGDCWGIGYPECYCHQDADHNDYCTMIWGGKKEAKS
jgi:hypothetical protein